MNKSSQIKQIVSGMQQHRCPSGYWVKWITDRNKDKILRHGNSTGIQFPELETSVFVLQRNNQTVWDHTMSVIDRLAVKNPITLLSGLFHDLGKSCVKQFDAKLSSRFPKHDLASIDIAKRKLKEWGTGSYVADRVIRLVSTHMYDILNGYSSVRERTIRKFVANVGLDNIGNWFVLRIADSQSYGLFSREDGLSPKEYSRRMIEPFRVEVMDYIERHYSYVEHVYEDEENTGSMQIEGGDA